LATSVPQEHTSLPIFVGLKVYLNPSHPHFRRLEIGPRNPGPKPAAFWEKAAALAKAFEMLRRAHLDFVEKNDPMRL